MSRPSPRSAALVGIGARLPGAGGADVRGPARMWEALRSGATSIGGYPADRWAAMQERLHPEDRGADPWPAALVHWPAGVDAKAFGLRPSDTAHLSPTQTLVLQVAAEALADAGIRADTLAGPRTGVYLGFASPDEALDLFADGRRPALPDLPAGGAGMVATPIARWLDSRGPLVTYDSSCSASMYALHAARRDLADGTVTTAVVIGASVLSHPVPTRAFDSGGVLARDGDVRPFDADAHGYVRGEAVVAAVLRTHERASRGRDRVYALVEHTAVGADGRSAGVGMPSADALAELMERAHTESATDPGDVEFVLTHGPGTAAGARAEARAMGRAFARDGRNPLRIGSVKGLWGHSEAAAGLTNLLAGALVLHHGGRIPPTAGHTTPPGWLDRYGLRVPAGPDERLPVRARTRVGVTALGFSGATAYALLRPAPRRSRSRGQAPADLGGAAAWPLSARTAERLRARAQVLAEAVGAGARPPGPHRVGDHLTRRNRPDLPVRAAVIATEGDRSNAHPAWKALAHGDHHPDLVGPASHPGPWRQVWAFGGHGAAHPAMAASLYGRDPVFAAHLDRALHALEPHTAGAPWRPGTAPRDLAQVQRATWAVQVALASTLTDRWGLRPDTVVGHSLGEVAAATVAGILSLSDAARLVSVRSDLLHGVAPAGGMVLARLDRAAAQDVAAAHPVDIACSNSPEHTVFSGDGAALRALVPRLEEIGADPRPLDGAPPAHGRHVLPLLPALRAGLEGLSPRPGDVEFVSTVTGTTRAGTELDAGYWADQLASTVEWEPTLTRIGGRGAVLLVEVSPKPVLSQPTARVRARHGLDIDTVCAGTPDDERRGPALVAAHAYTHHLPVAWPYAPDLPVDTAPAAWEAPPSRGEHWPDLAAGLRGDALLRALRGVVATAVASLSPTPVTDADHERDLGELGLHSFDRLALRHLLLSPLEQGPADLPPHEPTIASIAEGLAGLVDGPGPAGR
ncbi:Acyl transferase domain-containing protein [Nocardiopsis flavescens]|uniref:Acyl transferase domain-containing protein n=1 Tax=Nocardiopsis flavescens TaxID=758803 RepID=A0A1M6CGL0_9ACTN|nr:type I polyketide synthase [Nocardiopsis flavescens]SHI60160.1 Acyl transferase domain-containing protein [Nocardiopsis flavescens]